MDAQSKKDEPGVASLLFGLALSLCAIWLAAGCSSSLVAVKGNLPTQPGIKYVELVRPAPIVGVVIAREDQIVYDTLGDNVYPRLVRGSVPGVISFDSTGGNVQVDKQMVSGISSQGEEVEQAFSSLLYLQVKEVDLAKKFITPYDLTCDREDAINNPDKRIKHGSSPCWDVIEFDKHGGKYDSSSQAIVGISRRGSEVDIALDDCLQIRYRRPDPWQTMRLGVSLLGIFLFANGATHFWDFY
jgi:hypothetical protein